jgi:cell division inhibitor SepF
MKGEDLEDNLESTEFNMHNDQVDSNHMLKQRRESSKIVSINASVQMQVVIMYPNDIEDAALACDYINQNKTCIVNLEGIERSKSQRIADFLSGAVYIINGDIQRVSIDIFIVAPANVNITGEFKEELKANGLILPWASSS